MPYRTWIRDYFLSFPAQYNDPMALSKLLYASLRKEKERDMDGRYARLQNYEAAYKLHHARKISRAVSHTSISILRVFTLVIAFALLIVFIYSLFSENYVLRISHKASGEVKVTLEDSNRILGIIILVFGFLFFWISALLRKIKKKNSTVSKLAHLLGEVIEAEKKNIEAEKESYFNLLDTMMEDKASANKP